MVALVTQCTHTHTAHLTEDKKSDERKKLLNWEFAV